RTVLTGCDKNADARSLWAGAETAPSSHRQDASGLLGAVPAPLRCAPTGEWPGADPAGAPVQTGALASLATPANPSRDSCRTASVISLSCSVVSISTASCATSVRRWRPVPPAG